MLGELHAEKGLADTPAFATLWRHATGSLLKRSATPPKEPRHWKIAADIDCECDFCTDLRAFCKDPAAKVARFPLRAELRGHLHRIIEYNRLDIDHETKRRGRPYTLVCTKNRASHKRRLAEYSKDVSWMRRLIRAGRTAGRRLRAGSRAAARGGGRIRAGMSHALREDPARARRAEVDAPAADINHEISVQSPLACRVRIRVSSTTTNAWREKFIS